MTGREMVAATRAATKAIYQHVGYVEDWCVFPLDDSLEMFWAVDDAETRWCVYSPKREAVEYWLTHDEDWGPYGDCFYSDTIYTQRFLKKWVYRGAELAMVLVDTHTDGNKFLRLFLTANEVRHGRR